MDMAGGPRRGSDLPNSMSLPGITMHKFGCQAKAFKLTLRVLM